MGFITSRTQRVELGTDGKGDEFYAIIKELTQRQAAQAEAKLSQGIKVNASGGTMKESALNNWRVEQIVFSLVGWNLTDDSDVVLPCSTPDEIRTSVSRLPVWAFTALFDATEKLNSPPLTKEEVAEDARFPDADVGDIGWTDDNGSTSGSVELPAKAVVLDGAGDGV